MFPTGSDFNNDLKVIRLCFYESGTYQDQFRRPINTAVCGNTRQKIDELTHGGTMLQRGILNNIANDIIIPSTMVEKRIDVANGWREKRLRFLLELEITNRFGGFTHRKVITGWTSHMGLGNTPMAGHTTSIDQNMLMFINNDMTLRDTPVPAPDGRTMMKRTDRVSSDHLLLGTYDLSSPMSQEHSLRPEDIAANIATGATIMGLSGASINNAYSQFLTSPVKISSRQNEAPVHYLAKILKSYSEASTMYGEAVAQAETYDEKMLNALGLCKETGLSDNLFLEKLKRVSNFMDDGYFTMMSLTTLFPYIDNVTSVYRYSNTQNMIITPPVAGDSCNFDNADAVTLTMAKVMNALPGMMFDALLASGGFVFTNDTPGCQDTLTPIHPTLFGTVVDNLNIIQQVEQFKMRFLSELAPSITHHGQVSLTMKIICHVYGNTELTIDYNHMGEYKFNLPTFCDTLTSPMVTNNGQQLQTISRDINNLLGCISGQNHLDIGTFGITGSATVGDPFSLNDGLFGSVGPADVFAGAQLRAAPVPMDANTHSQKLELF